MSAAAEPLTPEELKLVERAREKYTLSSSNDIEIDEVPTLSHSDKGAFVSAWVWVPYPEEPEGVVG